MAYEHTNSKDKKYFLNSTLGGRNGKIIYFFTKENRKGIDLPQGYLVGENPLTGLPYLKKK